MLKVLIGSLTHRHLKSRAKHLSVGWSLSGGRNSTGRITSYKKGSFAVKRMYRFVDFWRRLAADAFVVSLSKDNFRSSTLTLLFYQTGVLSYVILPDGYSVGHKLRFSLNASVGETSRFFAGNALPLSQILEGAVIFNVELWPTKGAQLCRSAGTYAIVLTKRDGFVTLKLRSGWKVVVSENCFGTLGVAPNYTHVYQVLRKAGLNRNLGRRPTVRGVAMNAIDHPHGGGRGKTSGGPKPRTPWGKITKQQKTTSAKIRKLRQLTRFR